MYARFAGFAVAMIASILVPVHAQARDGNPDRSFGTNGKVIAKYTNWFIDSFNVDLALQPDGKLLVSASRDYADPDYDFGVMRLMADGSLDTSFGGGSSGQAFVSFDRSGSDAGDRVVGMALQSDGKIVLAGFADGDASTGEDMAIARLTSTGALDTTFGTAGKTIVQFNLGNCAVSGACDDQALRVNLQADGKILVTGVVNNAPDAMTPGNRFALVRLTTTGQRDSTFDADGRVTVQFGTGTAGRGLRARQLADTTHILAVGGANTSPGSTNFDFALVKLNENGSLDPTFGAGGKATYDFHIGGDFADIATDFVELPDGKIMVCGEVQVNNPSNFDFGCMQFLANGVPDPAFTPVLVPFDLGNDFQDAPFQLVRDARGRFVLGGYARRDVNSYDAAAARLHGDGTLDTSFGNGGIMTWNSLSAPGIDHDNSASALLVQPDGKIVLAGYADSDGTGKEQFELIRVIGDTIFEDGFED